MIILRIAITRRMKSRKAKEFSKSVHIIEVFEKHSHVTWPSDKTPYSLFWNNLEMYKYIFIRNNKIWQTFIIINTIISNYFTNEMREISKKKKNIRISQGSNMSPRFTGMTRYHPDYSINVWNVYFLTSI